jgi:predicted alpha/beta-fold hydrolase
MHDCGDTRKNHASTTLHVSAQEFLTHLGLPTVHPLCGSGSNDTVDDDNKKEVMNDDNATTLKKKTELDYILARINDGSIFELPNLADGTASSIINDMPPHATTTSSSPPPKVGPVPLLELHDNSIYELLLTLTAMTSSSIAMMELWLRFVALFICPLCTCYLIHCEVAYFTSSLTATPSRSSATTTTTTTTTTRATTKTTSKIALVISILGLSSSIVIFTDSLYVYEYGRRFGLSLFILSSVLAIRCSASASSSSVSTVLHRCTISVLIAVTIVIFLQSDGNTIMSAANMTRTPSLLLSSSSSSSSSFKNPLRQISHPGIDMPIFNDGIYYSKSNILVRSIISHWPTHSRTYTTTDGSGDGGATPYLVNGDQRTGIPFIINKVKNQEYIRVYTQNIYDDEYLALDIAFPYSDKNYTTTATTSDNDDNDNVQLFVHDITKPVYLLLHGLNGGSHEQYVMDMVQRRRDEGSTVIVFIARGMMDTAITKWNTFHGARTGDIDSVARSVRNGLESLAIANNSNRPNNERQLLAGVGYSMGAIILSNYVARSGDHCALDTAMAISGGLDMRQQINAKRSMRLWQPILTLGLRQDILLGKYGRHYKSRLTKDQMFGLLRATSISELDVEAIVTYNSFNSLMHYYSEMSAMGDREPEFNLLGPPPTTTTVSRSSNEWGRIGNVSIPFVVLQALDDPIVGWRTVGTSNPQNLVDSGFGNVMLLLTKAGGHVGWPIGLNPSESSWKWMNNAARDFVIATDIARREIVTAQL